MAREVWSLERTFNNSLGGPCDFPEPIEITIPIDANQIVVTKSVRGNMGETRRFRKLIEEMLKKGLITQEQVTQDWAKIK
ncbi:MAG: hypothetical protein WA152_00235 [Microgenomates group bacterium]